MSCWKFLENVYENISSIHIHLDFKPFVTIYGGEKTSRTFTAGCAGVCDDVERA